ncbi:hypothetical protein SARC_00795 [Sphaeroforma arctica JP610]|uniref:Nuclear nucleic acid-binding protein C1D n=1 Tax=Sphaeroforma arctica JP610 TaxID=667725 RepID=A0A0L0GDR7_9EUKA|nr:hypothetical protein SARC_00795 [Sphaeroforma arctica JP610]KNC87049.1 hypothetical protein SARC_00795 [Sphaeroforma arctica JP610]|eukprot:XP_014160951.1 hypothetical protein SARC_00795 [Sphaeroforma arctica JP610]
MSTTEVTLPAEVEDLIDEFDTATSDLASHLEPILNCNQEELKAKLTPAERAQLELAMAYAASSMFWMYLTTTGVDPRTHAIKGELDRVKAYMGRLKEATAPKNAAKLDMAAAGRFIRGGLADAEAEVKEKLTANIEKATQENEVATSRGKARKEASATEEVQDKDTSSKKRKKSSGKSSNKKKRKAE